MGAIAFSVLPLGSARGLNSTTVAVLRTHFICLVLGFVFLSDKDLQLPSGSNCNFDFPEEPCGWMYDHAKWLRSTWASSSSPDDRTFPGKPATSDELREDFPGGLVVKNPPAMQETRIGFLG